MKLVGNKGLDILSMPVLMHAESGSFYGISKLSSEKIVEEYQTRYGLDYTIIRYGSYMGKMPIIVMVFIDC